MFRYFFALIPGALYLYSGLLYAQVRTSVNSGSYNSIATWDCSCIPATTNDIIISTGHVVSLAANTTVNSVLIESGAQLNNNGRRLVINGNYTIDGLHSGNGDIRIMSLNAAIDGKGTISTGGDFEIRNNGIFIRDTASIQYTGGGLFRILGANTFTNFGSFTSTRVINGNNANSVFYNAEGAELVAGNNLMVTGQLNASDSGNSVEYNENANQAIKTPLGSTYYNLKLGGSGNKNLNANITVTNDVEIISSNFRTNSNDVEIQGDYINTGGAITPANGTITFSGSNDQFVSAPSEETFFNLTLNKGSGKLHLNQDVVVSNNLNLQNGVLDAQLNKITLGTGTGNIGSLTRTSGFVTGNFSRWINGGTSVYLYPLGDNSSYLPAQITFTTIIPGLLKGNFNNVFPLNSGLPLSDSPDSLFNTFSDGYWSFKDSSGLAGSVFNIQVSAPSFSSYTINPSTRLVFRDSPMFPWQIRGSHVNASAPDVFRNGLTGFPAEIALADTSRCLLPPPSTSSITGLTQVCKSASNVSYSVLSTPGSDYFWTVNGGIQISGGNTNSITVDWGSIGISGSVQVVEYDGCQFGTPILLSVEVQPVNPGSIVGLITGYNGTSNNLYYVDEAIGYTYNWTVSGAGIRSGSGSNDSIFIDFNAAGNCNIELYLSNGCGFSDTVSMDVAVSSVINSVNSGNWILPTTWDCFCNPGTGSSIRINAGHTITSSLTNEDAFALIIEPTGTLNISGTRIRIGNFLNNSGTITGSGEVRMNQSGTIITGSGSWASHNGNLNFQAGSHSILSGVNIEGNGDIRILANTFIQNSGSVSKTGEIIGASSSTWIQNENSSLEVGNFDWTNGSFQASAIGNTVSYSASGNFNRNVRIPDLTEYYNLNISGSAANSVYRINAGNVSILGDLNIFGGTFDASTSSNSVDIKGNWINSGGIFNPRSGMVTFSGVDQLISHSSRENFFDLRILSTGTVSSMCEIEVGRNLFNSLNSELDMNDTADYQLNVKGNLTNQGSILLHNNELLLDGTSLQSIKGNLLAYDLTTNNSAGIQLDSGLMSVRHILDINAGQLNTNNRMTFISNALETAMLSDMTGGGSIIGDVNVQRYLDEGISWYMLASPVTGTDIEDWNEEVSMSGFPGTDAPGSGFKSVQKYIESNRGPAGIKTNGYTPPSSTSDILNPGDGYFLYYQTSKPSATAKTLEVTGPLFTGTFSTGSLSHTVTGTLDDRGWHMIGNPYASPIQFDQLTLSNIANSTGYVKMNGGNYWDLVNDNIDYIYSSEAFWVKANSGGGSVTINENDKAIIEDDYNTRRSSPAIYGLPLKMVLTSVNYPNYSDYSVLRFGGDSNSVNYDPVVGESVKVPNSSGNVPNIASYSSPDKLDVYYNTLNPEVDEMTIPIRVFTSYPSNQNKNYKIEFEGIDAWKKNNRCILLSDSLNNTTKMLDSANSSYNWTMRDSTKSPKIFLQITSPLTTSQTDIKCFNDSNGVLSVAGENSQNGLHNYKWYNSAGNLLKTDSMISGISVLENLIAGSYRVEVTDNGACGTIGYHFELKNPEPLIADFDSPEFVDVNGDSVIFINESINADSNIWDFGDGIFSNEINPKHKYKAVGEFTVNLSVYNNSGCSVSVEKKISVENYTKVEEIRNGNDLRIYSSDSHIYISGLFNSKEPLEIIIVNSMGQEVIRQNISAAKSVRKVYSINNSKGVHLVRILRAGNVFTEKVLIR